MEFALDITDPLVQEAMTHLDIKPEDLLLK